MTGYNPAAWADFAVAVTGAASALSGLLFVAVSINLQRILSFPNLPSRAGQTLILLVTPLVVSVLVLIPGQPRGVLGTELLIGAAVVGAALGWLSRPATKAPEETRGGYVTARWVPSILITGLLAVGGATLLAGAGGGLYWIAPAVLVALIAGLGNAWVLLVEILR